MSLINEIVSWANSELADWQREAVKRLLDQDSLTSEDQEQLYNLFKKSHSLLEIDQELPSMEPIELSDGLGDSGTKHTIILKKIQEIKNVNALPQNCELSFAHTGLTVIYGENAAGKSGYARILKKSCFARDDSEKILGNVFAKSLSESPEAIVKISVDSRDEFPKWIEGQQRTEILANICVFDSKCARIIIDEKNVASYLPYGGDIFQKISAIVKDFKRRIEKEKPIPLKPEISDLLETTKAGELFKSINSETKDSDLAEWFHWEEEDDAVLNQKSLNYIKAQAGDTTKQITALENIKDRLNSFKAKLEEYVELFSSKSIKNINQLIQSRSTYQKASEIASRKPDGPLKGIATNEWEELYWAAKDYSTKQAYPEKDFPVISENSKCVLCMQTLLSEARDRLNKFHEYMENSAKKSLDDTSKKLKDLIASINNFDLERFRSDYKDVLDEIKSRNKELAQNISELFSYIPNIRNFMIKAESDKSSCSEEGKNFKFAKLEKLPGIIVSEIEQCRKNSDPEGLKKLENELLELKAKKQFAQNEKNITAYVNSLKKYSLYNNALTSLNTTVITNKEKDLVGRSRTPQLETALSNELIFFRANHIPLKLKHSGIVGESVHQMKIDGQKETDKIKLSEILSEGEERIIGIAGFLAELNLQENTAPIVFDDPVSSLDHKFSEKVAERLVQESSKRQVIVFTHDISFLLDLQEKSKSQGQYCHCVNVHREGRVAGVIRGEEPWHTMSVNKRLDFIAQEVIKIANLFQSNQQDYNQQAGILYGYLRETWEAAIEECLFNKVIRRFQAEVKTQSLKEVTIENSDYDTIEEEMTKCSKWMIGHDLSKQISDNRPPPYELKQDIQKLRDFAVTLKKRRKTMIAMQQIDVPEIG